MTHKCGAIISRKKATGVHPEQKCGKFVGTVAPAEIVICGKPATHELTLGKAIYHLCEQHWLNRDKALTDGIAMERS